MCFRPMWTGCGGGGRRGDFGQVLADPDAAVLDICCGTGDMTMALLKRRPRGCAADSGGGFFARMLSRGAKKFGGPGVGARKAGQPYAVPMEADALHLPLESESLDLIVSAFGFRNLANYEAGLREFHRVLKPGGQLGILDFSEPGGLIGKAYAVYFRRVLPAIGRADLRQGGRIQLSARFGGQLSCRRRRCWG